jgi:hypothetical protein
VLVEGFWTFSKDIFFVESGRPSALLHLQTNTQTRRRRRHNVAESVHSGKKKEKYKERARKRERKKETGAYVNCSRLKIFSKAKQSAVRVLLQKKKENKESFRITLVVVKNEPRKQQQQ